MLTYGEFGLLLPTKSYLAMDFVEMKCQRCI